MSRNGNAKITYCSFSPPAPATKFYMCYKKEVCCQQGCCINGPYQVYQVWYYWLLFLVIFGIISGASWLCKKPRAVACRGTSRDTPTSSRNSYCSNSGCSRRRCGVNFNSSDRRECSSCASTNATDFEDNVILDRLFVSFRNRNSFGDPPSYSSILSQDYNKPPTKCSPLYSYYGPPPTYSSMYEQSSDSYETPQATTNENPSNYSLGGTTANVIQIQVHSEEHGNNSPNSDNKENDVTKTPQTDHVEPIIINAMGVSANDGGVSVSTSNNATIIERNHSAPGTVNTQLANYTIPKDA